ncbi:nucleotidyltransferase substrate binding protein [Tuberibacillus sp. Marseille-P3662]|uniref:nucleotidyltransferase substrate binding protein n=1 Tax=Tuberibacillus sp. Marseille-P3662 TaxID=1965358 RepID=UPI0034E8A2B8
MAFQIDLIGDGHVWMDALSKRNLTTHTYDEALVKTLIMSIRQEYLPALKTMYDELSKE